MLPKKFKIVIILILISGLFLLVYQKEINRPSIIRNKIKVVTSIYPLYFFAKEIGGDKVDVTNITPAGSEPHDYDLSIGDISKIESSDILVLNGGQMEPWGNKIKEILKGKKPIIISASDGLTTLFIDSENKLMLDPHVWLVPKLAQKEVDMIANGFINYKLSDRLYFEKNAKKLIDNLEEINQAYIIGLKNCRHKNIVTSHAAFGYIAREYNLKQISLTGLSPDSEPSPQRLGDIAQFVKTNKVKYIFFESLVSPRIAETLAQETGAKTLVFNPLEGLTKNEVALGKDYISIQKENLANLKTALLCN
jgi:zinc transport system substrate-binding protein